MDPCGQVGTPTWQWARLPSFFCSSGSYLACRYFGFYTGDDVEMLDAAFRTATGLDVASWGIRNLLLPNALMAPLVWTAARLGVSGTASLIVVATLPFLFAASANILLVYALARRLARDERVATLAATLYGLHWLPLGFGSTPYPRTLAVTLILLAALMLVREPLTRRPAVAFCAGVLAAAAATARYSELVFLAPLLALVVARPQRSSRYRAVAFFLAGAATGFVLTVGLVDRLTWGRWFSSFAAFAQYTLIERRASSGVVSQPLLWYFQQLLLWLPLTALPALWRSWSRSPARLVWLFMVLPLGVLSLIHHKQLRYLQGIIPFLAIVMAIGFVGLWDDGRRRASAVLVVLTAVWGLSGLHFLGKKSMAAVAAARDLAADSSAHVLVLSQSWAWGGKLYLGNGREVRDIPTPPSVADVARALAGADTVGLYTRQVAAAPEIRRELAARGFTETGRYEWGGSKGVTVYRWRGGTLLPGVAAP